MTLFVHNNGFDLQVLASYVAKIAQPSVWPLAFIPCAVARTAVWTGWGRRSVPKMDRVMLEKLVREGGDVPLPEYVTIQREDGSSISLGPRLTQPCTSTKFGAFEVVTTARGPVAQLLQCKGVSNTEEEEFEEMLERRRANLDDEERNLEEQAEEDEDSEPKEEPKKEEAEDYGGEEERRRRVHQRRRPQPGKFFNRVSVFVLCPPWPGLCVTLLRAGDHEPLRLRGRSGRGVGGLGGPRRRRPTVQQLKANSRIVHPEYLSQQDLYEFSRLDS